VTVSDSRSGAGSAASPLVITRTYTATDAAGNTASAVQTITVVDNTPPTIIAPAGVTLYTGPGATACGVTVSNPDQALGTATASDNCAGVTVARSGSTFFPVGDTVVTYTATDAAGNTAAATQLVRVVDNTPPVITTPGNITVGNDPNSCSAVVSFSVTATDNCGGASVTTSVPSGTSFQKGTTTVVATATDAAGNTSTASFTVTVNDTQPPVVTVPADITVSLPANSTATSQVVTYSVTAADNCPGVTLAVNPASGSAFPVGTTTVTATATDAAGNATTRTFKVTVRYIFTGFFAPVINLPTLNVVNAGRAIPVKFSLSGNKGLSILPADSPQSGLIPCDASAPAVDLTDTTTAGSSSLSYDAGSDQYNYVWATNGAWAGTCRQLQVTLNDGSVHVANFKFR
jgi:hypothetical protein